MFIYYRHLFFLLFFFSSSPSLPPPSRAFHWAAAMLRRGAGAWEAFKACIRPKNVQASWPRMNLQKPTLGKYTKILHN